MNYKILTFKDAIKLGYSNEDYDNDPQWYEYRSGVFLMEKGIPIEMLGCDGGEPEDQTLGRDWSWIVDALNDAYRNGFDDGEFACLTK